MGEQTRKPTSILGISCWYHDAAACLIQEGRITAAAQEERFSRKKHDASFPHQAIAYCLAAGGVAADELAAVVFYDKPFLKFERLLETYLAYAPRGLQSFIKAMPLWLKQKLWIPVSEPAGCSDPCMRWRARLRLGVWRAPRCTPLRE